MLLRPEAENQCPAQEAATPEQSGVEALTVSKRPLAHIDKSTILDRIASGEYVPAIAESIGVSKQALSQALARWDKQAYQEARETAAEIRLDEATMAIEQAADVVDLARARERFRAVAWRAEREHPQRWAARPQTAVQINGSGEMQVQIVSYAGNNAPQHPSLPDNPSQVDS